MATFAQIKDRIITKYKSLPTQKEKLEFLYEVQERLRIKHNEKGKDFRDEVIDEPTFRVFQSKWNAVNTVVSEQIAKLRNKVFTEDYALLAPDDIDDTDSIEAWTAKKESLKAKVAYKTDIDTIWQ